MWKRPDQSTQIVGQGREEVEKGTGEPHTQQNSGRLGTIANATSICKICHFVSLYVYYDANANSDVITYIR